MHRRKPGKWNHTRVFEEVEVAVDSDLLPSQFWAADERDRAFLIARKRAKGTMEGWEAMLHEEKMAEMNKTSNAKGASGKQGQGRKR